MIIFLRVCYKKKYEGKKLGVPKVTEERIRIRSWIQDPLVRGTDPDPHQNVTDPKYCAEHLEKAVIFAVGPRC
jgi:hypothetical protein